MENITAILALLMFLSATASDISLCVLNEIDWSQNKDITVEEKVEGCRTSFLTEDKREVHIFNLLYRDSMEYAIFGLRVEVPAIVIFTSTIQKSISVAVSQVKPTLSLYVTNGTSMIFYRENHSTAPNLKGIDLVKWANQEFGGVTSFTTVYEPQGINVTEKKEVPQESICNLQREFPRPGAADQHKTPRKEIKSCLITGSQDHLHIINIPDNVSISNVTVEVEPSDVRLVLRGPAGTQWKVQGYEIRTLSNNEVEIHGMKMAPISNISDVFKEIWQQTLAYYTCKSISSYTEIRFNAPEIKVKINQKEPIKDTATPTMQSPTSPPSHMQMELFTSSDYSSSLDPSDKVQTNKRLYGQIYSSVFNGHWILIIRVTECWVLSKGLQPVVRKIPIKQESCGSKMCHNNARFSFSFETLQDLLSSSTSWDLECNIVFCPDQVTNCTPPQLVKRSVQVTQANGPISNPCFEFGLPSVLGIAFGGFLIGVLLISALWFIKIRTAYEGRVLKGGEGDLDKPRDDLPLEIR